MNNDIARYKVVVLFKYLPHRKLVAKGYKQAEEVQEGLEGKTASANTSLMSKKRAGNEADLSQPDRNVRVSIS
jgi:hypothetical protein